MEEGKNEEHALLELGLTHAWSWFELHARQRLQAVNFFLIAVAFLISAYVASLRVSDAFALIAAIVGLGVSACFYVIEIRTRELVKIGESAMGELERRLSGLLSLNDLEFVARADKHPPGQSYRLAIAWLYGCAAIAFVGGTVLAVCRL